MKYNVSIPDYINSLCVEQLENAIRLADKRLKELRNDKKYRVFSARSSDLKRDTVYYLADDDGLNKARKMLAKWVTDDMDGSASEQPYYSIDSFYCCP